MFPLFKLLCVVFHIIIIILLGWMRIFLVTFWQKCFLHETSLELQDMTLTVLDDGIVNSASSGVQNSGRNRSVKAKDSVLI